MQDPTARVAPDRELLEALAAGARASLAPIYHRHKDGLFNAAFHLVGSRERAEDVLHDVFLQLVRSAPRLQLRGSLRSYLIAAAVHRCRDLARREAVRRRPAGEEPVVDPTNELLRREQHDLLTESLRALGHDQKEVVVLHIFEEMTFGEIADQLGISINTAMSRWRYALEALRGSLQRRGVEG